MKSSFWTEEISWPRAPGGYLFLGEAARLAGRRLFPDEWSDTDFILPSYGRLPAYQNFLENGAYWNAVSRGAYSKAQWVHFTQEAARLLDEIWPADRRSSSIEVQRFPPLSTNGRSAPPPLILPTFSREEWTHAKAYIDLLWDRTVEERRRAASAVNFIVNACSDGSLRTFVRPKGELELTAVDEHWWSAAPNPALVIWSGCELEFSLGKLSLNRQAADGRYGPLFVLQEQLQHLLPVPTSKSSVPTSTSGAEARAIRALADALRLDKDLSRKAGADLVGYTERSRAFDHRIWPRARAAANLSPTGKPGRKRSVAD